MADVEVLSPASKFSLAKERVLQKLGAHEKSKDQTYYESKEKIAKLEGIGTDISSILDLWFKKVCELSSASISLSKVWMRVYEGTNERMESVARAYCQEQEAIKNVKIPKLQERVEMFTKEINNYMTGVDSTREAMESRRKLQLSFDHYNSKCIKLQAQQQKNRLSGKLETLKQREKFERNTQKLNSARSAFLQANQTVIKSMHHHWESRFGFLDNLFKKVVMNETMFFEAIAKTLSLTKPLLNEAMKKPLPKPAPPPSQQEMDELNDKVKFGNQTQFGSAENGANSISGASLEGNQNAGDSFATSLAERGRSSSVGTSIGKPDTKLGALMGKAKSLFSKKRNDGSLAFVNATDLCFTGQDNALEEKTEQPGVEYGVQQQQPEIDQKDPFKMFDADQELVDSSSVNQTVQANPFNKPEERTVVQDDPWNMTSQKQENPFAVAGQSQDPFSAQVTRTVDPFAEMTTTPNPFAGENIAVDFSVRKSSPSPDPFASFFG